MEPEVSELPKGLVLGRDENIHIRLTRSTSLGNVGSYNKSQRTLFKKIKNSINEKKK